MSGAVLRYMATAPRGLADLVARELRALGVTGLAERTAGVRFAGELRRVRRLPVVAGGEPRAAGGG